MTKKDYELFANEIYKQNLLPQELEAVVDICSKVFEKDNPLFQQGKFERACYEGKHIRQSIKTA